MSDDPGELVCGADGKPLVGCKYFCDAHAHGAGRVKRRTSLCVGVCSDGWSRVGCGADAHALYVSIADAVCTAVFDRFDRWSVAQATLVDVISAKCNYAKLP